MVARQVTKWISEFNADRNPSGIKRKEKEMAKSPFGFFRGTCHLFYQDLPRDQAVFQTAPPVWLCGDLHLQNFGSYKGEDRLVYFDINDFDEGLLAPCTWDLARFVTSIFVAAESFDLDWTEAQNLAQQFLAAYAAALKLGKARTIHRETAEGLVCDLLEDLRNRDRAEFLDTRSEKSGNQRQLKLMDNKTEAIPKAEQAFVSNLLQTWANTQTNPEFYEVLDVVRRIAGNGSLGLERYLILIEGKGSPNKNYLLDLKGTRPSSLQPYCPIAQPIWLTQADRIVTLQRRFQESPPALLHAVHQGDKSYILRELQPTADKIDLTNHQGKFKQFSSVVKTMAQVTAWGQLRSSGRQNSASADMLVHFADQAQTWQPVLIDYATQYAHQVQVDHQTFQQELATK